MGKYRILLDGDLQDEVFDTEDEAEDYAMYLVSCSRTGAVMLEMSIPGDYPMDDYEDRDYEIIEED